MSHSYDDVVFGRCDPDMGIKVGDPVTTYHKGYWIVTKVEKRFYEKPTVYDDKRDWPDGAPMPSIIHYRKIADTNGKAVSSKRINVCCATYCKVIDRDFICDQYDEETKAAKAKLDGLHEVLVGIRKGEIKP